MINRWQYDSHTLKKKALHVSVFSSIKYIPIIKPIVCSTNTAQYNHLSVFSTV